MKLHVQTLTNDKGKTYYYVTVNGEKIATFFGSKGGSYLNVFLVVLRKHLEKKR